MTSATAIAARSLTELEAIVDDGLHKFIEVGEALAEIRERRLYRETHERFEAYCSDRYNLKRQRAYELMAAANVVARVSEISDTVPERESHAAALAPLREDPPSMVDALTEAAQETDGKVTAAAIERAVDRRLGTERKAPAAVAPAEIIEPEPAPISSAPPTNQAEMAFLVADLAAFIRDRVLTKIVLIDGMQTRHDRHCTATADRPTCAEKCDLGRSLIQRAELV